MFREKIKVVMPIVFIIVFLALLLMTLLSKEKVTQSPSPLKSIKGWDFGDGQKNAVLKGDNLVSSSTRLYKNLTIEGSVKQKKSSEPGALVFRATEKIVIEETAVLDASGGGYSGSAGQAEAKGPGAGISFQYAGGGGSHGGSGGPGELISQASPKIYGSGDDELSFGSGGSAGKEIKGTGGAGGGCVILSAPEVIIKGKIISDGLSGKESGGGGAGGKIIILGQKIFLEGLLRANGGSGGTSLIQGAGGGGGGVIVIYQKHIGEGKLIVDGGKGGRALDIYTGGEGTAGTPGLIFSN